MPTLSDDNPSPTVHVTRVTEDHVVVVLPVGATTCPKCTDFTGLPDPGTDVSGVSDNDDHEWVLATHRDEHGAVTMVLAPGVHDDGWGDADEPWRNLYAEVGEGMEVEQRVRQAAPLLLSPMGPFAASPQREVDFVNWCLLGFTVEQALAAEAAGMPVVTAASRHLLVNVDHEGDLIDGPLTADEMLAWHEEFERVEPGGGFEEEVEFFEHAARWVALGVRTPRERPAHTTEWTAMALVSIGLPVTTVWPTGDWALCPTFAAVAVEAQVEPALAQHFAMAAANAFADEDSGAMCDEHTALDDQCGWTVNERKAVLRAARRMEGLDWADAAVCFIAGLSLSQTERHLRDGADLEPVRLLAALNG